MINRIFAFLISLVFVASGLAVTPANASGEKANCVATIKADSEGRARVWRYIEEDIWAPNYFLALSSPRHGQCFESNGGHKEGHYVYEYKYEDNQSKEYWVHKPASVNRQYKYFYKFRGPLDGELFLLEEDIQWY